MSVPDLSWLEGAEVASVSLTEPVGWWFKFSDNTQIMIETFWRVVAGGCIEATSADHGHRFGLPAPVDSCARAVQALARAKVHRAHVVPATGDLLLEFDNGAGLEILMTSTGYEGWSITSPGRDQVIGTGSGVVAVLPRT
jgi:hypothetical protein